MKNIKLTLVFLLIIMLQATVSFSQGIAVNDDGTDADASAILDVKSAAGTQGFLLPRVTEAQKNAISAPAASLLVYQTDGISGFYFYNGSGWEYLGSKISQYADVASAEAASGSDNDLCFVASTGTFYRYEANGAANTDNNQYVLSTNDAGNTRWLGVAGRFDLGSIFLDTIVHLDASSGSATITELNRIYYITAASSTTTITIPDADTQNEGWFLRLYKEAGNGVINLQTTSGQNIDGASPASIYNIGKGLYVKSDNATEWLKIQDSRSAIPKVVNTTTDYDAADFWGFDFLTANTDGGDITITLSASIANAPDGNKRMFFNTGSNLCYINPNGNTIDDLPDFRAIGPKGYMEIQKINNKIKIVREKNVSIKKLPDDISYLNCWLDASQLSGTDGSSLASWSDLSGNGNNFTAVNAPVLKTSVQNGKNVVYFDGIDDVMSAGDVELHDNTRGFTIIAVVKPSDTKRMAILSKYQTSPDGREFAFGNKDNFLFEDLDWGSYTGTVMAMGLNKFQIVEYVWKPGEPFQLYINGALQTTGNAVVNDITDGPGNLKLGCGDYTSVGYWDGDIAEIMTYSQAVSDTERENLRNNLADKWDIDAIIIANGGAKFWQRNDNTNTISPDIANDNLDLGTGTLSGGTLNASELINAPALSTAPASPQSGSIYYDTNDNKLKVWTGSAWENLN